MPIKKMNKLFLKEKSLLLLFIIAPFIHVFKLKFGNFFSYSIYIGILFILIMLSKKNEFNKFFSLNMTIFHLLIINILLMFLYHLLYYSENYYFNILFYGGNILFFYIFVFIGLSEFVKKYYVNLLQYYFILLSATIIIDFIFIQYKSSYLELMYSDISLNNNLVRPLGLFGQASVNSVVLVFLYILILAADTKYKFLSILKKILYTVLVTVGVVLQGSGTGGITLIISLFLINFSAKKLAASLFIFIVFYLFILSYLDENSYIYNRLSYEYIYTMMQIFYTEIFAYTNYISSPMDLLFGISESSDINYGNLGTIKIIAKSGLIYFMLYTILLYQLIKQANNRYYTIALVSIIIGSLHYEAMYWSYFMLFLWTLVYYDILFIKREYAH